MPARSRTINVFQGFSYRGRAAFPIWLLAVNVVGLLFRFDANVHLAIRNAVHVISRLSKANSFSTAKAIGSCLTDDLARCRVIHGGARGSPSEHGRAPRWITRIRSPSVSRFAWRCALRFLPNGPAFARINSSLQLDALADGPDKPGELAREGDDDLVRVHAPGAQAPVLGAQAQLRFPGDIAGHLG